MKSWRSILLAIVIGAVGIGGFIFVLRSVVEPKPVSQNQEDVLSLSLLNNLEYYHSYCKVPLKLTDGVFQWTNDYPCEEEKSLGFLFQIYNSKAAFGDLNFDGKDDAAVVLTTHMGGSGNFRELAVVLNQNGVFKHVASVDLGDRVIIENVSIQDSHIVLDMVVHGPGEGYCCPTQQARNMFQFDTAQNKLIKL
ncbi:MAG TPA: hypothetical protein VJC15_01775 [Candidatus Paceibacterota bacterium]